MLAGSLKDAINMLADILGVEDAAKRITFDSKTNTIDAENKAQKAKQKTP